MSDDASQQRRNRIGVAVFFVLALVMLALWPRPDAPARSQAGAADAGSAGPERAPARAGERPRPGQPAALRVQPVTPIPAAVERASGPATFEGKVLSLATSLGVAGAEVTFEHGGAAFVARTDESGSFRFLAEQEGEWSLAVVAADGFHAFAPEWGHSPISLSAQRGRRVTGLVFSLAPAVEYRGRVLAVDGSPVEGAQVELVGAGTGEAALVRGPSQWTTDAEGRFTFTARDEDWLTASHPRHGRGSAQLDFEAQVKGELLLVLSRELGAPRGAISGKVVDGARRPQPGALVFLSEERRFSWQPEDDRAEPPAPGQVERAVETGADGRFRFEGLDGERYVVAARARGLAPAAMWASQGDDVLLTLSRAGRISGVVRDARGQPVPAFTLVVSAAAGPLRREPFATEAFISAEGRFALEGVPDGEYALVAGAVGYAPSEEVSASVRGGKGATVALRLSQGGTAVGRVIRREDGAPLEKARVAVEGNWGEGASALPLVAEARSGPDGSFKLSGLAPGARSLFVSAAGRHGRLLSGLQIREGQTVGPLEVDLGALDGGSPQIELVGIGAVLAAVDRPELAGTTDGGVAVLEQSGALLIRDVLPGGGAAAAGLGPGDLIYEIDGRKVAELGFGPSIEAIRGQEGTLVQLLVKNRESGERKPVAVKRTKIAK